jgi:hypothetical protein
LDESVTRTAGGSVGGKNGIPGDRCGLCSGHNSTMQVVNWFKNGLSGCG